MIVGNGVFWLPQVLHDLWINEGYTSPTFLSAAQVTLPYSSVHILSGRNLTLQPQDCCTQHPNEAAMVLIELPE